MRFDVDFAGGTPRLMKALWVLWGVNFVLNFATDWWAERYAPRFADAAHPFPLHFKGSVVVFVPAWLGHYSEWGFWAQFVLLGIIFLALRGYARSGRAITSRL